MFLSIFIIYFFFFFFQAEDGIRDAQESRGLGDVYKRQDKLWQAVNEATNPQTKLILAREYLKAFPTQGLHSHEATSLDAEAALQDSQAGNRDYLNVLALKADAVRVDATTAVSYTHLRAHETPEHLVCRLLPENTNH